jgi:Ras GTPase-activating-like protein IQGAP2/3
MCDTSTRELLCSCRTAWPWRRFVLKPVTHRRARLTQTQRNEVADHLDESDELTEGAFPNDDKTQKYGNLLFLLQSEPKHIAHLCRLVTLAEIDQLLQTVMFTIYGNQYESREEHLLLTMFQVRLDDDSVSLFEFCLTYLFSPF